MTTRSWAVAGAVLAVGLAGGVGTAAPSAAARADGTRAAKPAAEQVRFATFNASLNRAVAGELAADLATPDDAQAATVAEIIQRVRPDVLLVNEFDHDDRGRSLRLFQDNYLSVPHRGAKAINYPYRYSAPSNTGLATGLDLNNNGTAVTTPGTPGYADDAKGFGEFPGQYGMAVFSRYPILTADVRTFQDFLWKDMPGNRIPPGFYTEAEQAVLPLSSKSHWDVPVLVGKKVVHAVVSHPTPPVFDGPEDRNGRRNADEIRLSADLVRGGRNADYLVDDQGRRGGLPRGARFVVMGDQNSDPRDGDSLPGAIAPLLDSSLTNSRLTPSSLGGPEASAQQGGVNTTHTGNPRFDSADFNDAPGTSGNLRVDYVLPSRNLPVAAAAVFWPRQGDPLSRLTGVFPFPSSDHRLVYVDVRS